MWNIKTVKELFEQLNNTWIDRTGEPLKLEYNECIGNFISYIDLGHGGDNSLLYISDLANDPHIPEEIVRMKFIYSFFLIKQRFEISRFIQCRNTSGMMEFLERISKYICEKCGYAFFTHDNIIEATSEYSEEFIKRIITEHENDASIRIIASDYEYKIERIDSEGIFIRPVTSDYIINMDELKIDKKHLPYLKVSF